MPDKEQIIIDGVEYNPCNGCKLWNGHHCIGARSYEPNADEHKAICNEHVANQFHKVYQQLYRKTQECEQKEKELKELKRQYKLSCLDCEYKNTKTDADRYRKALEEIEKELKEDVYCESQECGCDDFEECLNCVKTQILDIINKAKGNN